MNVNFIPLFKIRAKMTEIPLLVRSVVAGTSMTLQYMLLSATQVLDYRQPAVYGSFVFLLPGDTETSSCNSLTFP